MKRVKQVIIFAKPTCPFAPADMTNPLVHAFFLGRATAEVLSEELEHGLTDLLSTIGKFDAEQRERLRNFTQQVVERAETNAAHTAQTQASAPATANGQQDMQEIIDELRAEIAQLRSALQTYRSQNGA